VEHYSTTAVFTEQAAPNTTDINFVNHQIEVAQEEPRDGQHLDTEDQAGRLIRWAMQTHSTARR
jgi:thiamine monophosphate synthase